MLPLLVLNRDSKMWTLPLFQYNYAGQYFNDYGPSFASYVVGIISITIVYLFFQRHIISGYSMKIKEQTRKLAAGCSKQCFEVADGN
ncbi:hypothetical protein NTPn43_04890 [Streptococcus pneumoniae]|nr:hypothetical protein NTPn43_04890 [Streptococcus pneumoniae]